MEEREAVTGIDDTVVVDQYDGAYGPTLRIDVASKAALSVVRGWFQTLDDGATKERVLRAADVSLGEGLKGVRLRVSGRETGVTLLEDGTVDWVRDRGQWLEAAGMADGLLASAGGAHQYLSDESKDAVLVELACMERGPK